MAKQEYRIPPSKDQAVRIEQLKLAAKKAGMSPPKVFPAKNARSFGTTTVTIFGKPKQSPIEIDVEIKRYVRSMSYLFEDGWVDRTSN